MSKYDIVSLPIELGTQVDSKYRLSVVAGQRALQILKGSRPRVDSSYRKPTTVALSEVQRGMVPYRTGAEAEQARQEDEVLYKQVLAEVRSTYVDEEGRPLFGTGPGHHRHGGDPHPGPAAPAPRAG